MKKIIIHILLFGNKLSACYLIKLCLFFIFTHQISAQEQATLQFSEASSLEILQSLEASLNQTINYNHDFLPQGIFSFSASGDEDELLQVVFNVLDRDYVRLGDKVIALSHLPLAAEKKLSVPIIDGTIRNESGELMPYAQILSEDIAYLTTSNQRGEYSIEGFYSDDEVFVFTYLGYADVSISYASLGSKPNVSLTEKDHQLSEIIIRDQIITADIASGYEIFDKADIDLSNTGYQDVVDMSLLQTGVFNSGESVSELQIRGGPTDQVGVEWNGIRLFQTSLMYGKVSSVNPFMVSQIEISKNGGDASESGQASGMLRYSSHQQIIDTFSFNLHANLLYSNVGISIPLWKDKLSVKAAYRFSQNKLFNSRFYQNNIDAVFQESDILNDRDFYREIGNFADFTQDLDVEFNDVNLALQFHPTERDEITASYLSVGNDLTYKFTLDSSDEEPYSEFYNTNSGYSAAYQREWNSWFKSSLAYSSSQYNQDYFKQIPFVQGLVIFNRTKQETIDAQISLRSPYGQLIFGAQTIYGEAAGLDSLNHKEFGILENNRFSTSGREYSVFAQYTHQFFNRIHLNAGLRYSDYEPIPEDRRLLEPKIHLTIDLSNNLMIHGHYSRSHQLFNSFLYGLSLQAQNDFFYLANTRDQSSSYILKVKNDLQSLGVRYHEGGWKFDLEAYHKVVNDVQTTALDLRWYEDLYTFAQMNIKGIEASLTYQSKITSIIATYQHVDEEVRYNDNFSEVFRSPYFQPHRISLFQSIVLHPFTINIQWKYATGRLYSAPAGIDVRYNDFYKADDYIPYYDSRFDQQIRDYHNLDLHFFYQLPFQKYRVQAGLHINNVYRRDNALLAYHVINYSDTPATTFYFEREGLPFSYNFSLDMHF